MASPLKHKKPLCETDAMRLAEELATEASSAFEGDDLNETFNALVGFAKEHDLTAIEIGALLAILRRTKGLPDGLAYGSSVTIDNYRSFLYRGVSTF